MAESKEWNWEVEQNSIWLDPCEESYYYCNKWQKEGMHSILDLGCGLGRHAILFAKEGFQVTAVDLSKDSWSYYGAGYPKLDENTVIKTEEGPEKGIPHFYVEQEDIPGLFPDFELHSVRHVKECYFQGMEHYGSHYFVYASVRKAPTP